MDVYDIKSKEEWQDILDDVSHELGIPASLADNKNAILQSSGKRNELCLKIRANSQALTFICGQTQQFMAEQAKSTKRPFIDACEAGMSKFVLPLFLKGEWVGSFTACGACIPGNEIEDFIIQKNSGLSEEEINLLKVHVPQIEESKFVETANRLFNELQKYA
ncbi:MAG: PocR ligand-binding domain-containing protein [Deltaproteobacteria bacterium]|nr:PocR ligand-binding domain-containing protein [Deltaproteobacteria bacterium]